MNKTVIIASVAGAVLLAAGIGGTVAFMGFLQPAGATAQAASKPPPKPPLFAELDNLVVSVPADSTDATPTYVQITLQFATTETNAITAFGTFEPVIKADVLTLLMGQTAKALMDPATHDALTQNCVAIVNKVLDQQAGYTPPDPFSAAYITNLLQQN